MWIFLSRSRVARCMKQAEFSLVCLWLIDQQCDFSLCTCSEIMKCPKLKFGVQVLFRMTVNMRILFIWIGSQSTKKSWIVMYLWAVCNLTPNLLSLLMQQMICWVNDQSELSSDEVSGHSSMTTACCGSVWSSDVSVACFCCTETRNFYANFSFESFYNM